MTFFDSIRASFGPLSQGQVNGINELIDATEGLSIFHTAYVLATAWHETARTMQPIYERGKRKYFDMYEPPSKKAKALGNTIKGDGYKYRGRGYVQITGRANYHKASGPTHKDLVENPDIALEPAVAATIIRFGMEQGWFTGKRMADYNDYRSMRRVVNGTDKADLIAGYAEKFEAALKAVPKLTPHIQAGMAAIAYGGGGGGYAKKLYPVSPTSSVLVEVIGAGPTPPPATEPKRGFWARLWGWA